MKTNDAGEILTIPVEETLKQRGNRYGEFSSHAKCSQQLKQVLYGHLQSHNQRKLEPYMVEALDMIVHKLARIANGDPFYDDNWRDIAGYSQLVVNELNKKDSDV